MELFSRKYKLYRPSIGLIHEEVPDGVRRALLNLLEGGILFTDSAGWKGIQDAIFKAPEVRCEFEIDPTGIVASLRVKEIAQGCEWYTFMDICELLAALFRTQHWKAYQPSLTDEAFEEAINEIFADNSLGYELRDGRIERFGAPFVDEALSKVRQLLRQAEYAGPNEQFEKAMAFLNRRPNPDTANCVKDAVGAVEALARIVTGNESLVLSSILDREPLRSGIHGALRQMMHKLYAYRGDAEGAAHGQTSIGQITVKEAELALGVSASCMIYLAKKFGKEP